MDVLVTTHSIHYNGVRGKQVKEARGKFTLQPKESRAGLNDTVFEYIFAEDTLILTVTPEEYMDKLVEYCMVKVYGMIRVVDTNQTWVGEDDFVMDKPRLDMEVLLTMIWFSGHIGISFITL